MHVIHNRNTYIRWQGQVEKQRSNDPRVSSITLVQSVRKEASRFRFMVSNYSQSATYIAWLCRPPFSLYQRYKSVKLARPKLFSFFTVFILPGGKMCDRMNRFSISSVYNLCAQCVCYTSPTECNRMMLLLLIVAELVTYFQLKSMPSIFNDDAAVATPPAAAVSVSATAAIRRSI